MLALLAVLMSAAPITDSTRCTWEGRLPARLDTVRPVARTAEGTRLLELLRIGNKHERQMAARALGALGDTSAVAALIVASRDTNAHVALEAVWALGRLPDRRTETPLQEALGSANVHIQQAAACGLGRSGGTGSRAALRRLQRSPNPFVSSAATWALSQIASSAPARVQQP